MIILTYLLKVFVCSGLLYAYYHFILRNQKYHQYNRFFLLLLPVASFVLPLLKLPIAPEQAAQSTVLKSLSNMNVSGLENEVVVYGTASTEPFEWLPIVTIIVYLSGTIALLIPLVRSLRELLMLMRVTRCEWIGTTQLFFTDLPGAPFSFFRTIYWNKQLSLSTEEGQQIFRHELYHVENRHSLDIIYLEILRSVIWINPFFHLLRKEIEVVHEFLADEHIARGNRFGYAELLVRSAINERKNNITHSFFTSPFKRRIAMITRSNVRSFSHVRKLAVLPVFILLFSAFAEHPMISVPNRHALVAKDTIPQSDFKKSEIVTVVAYAPDDSLAQDKQPGQGKTPPRPQKPATTTQDDVERTFTKVQIEPSYPGGVQSWMRYLTKTFRYPEEARKRKIEGFVVVRFIVEKDGTVRNVQAISGPETGGLREEAVSVIERSGKWEPGVQNGKKVPAYKKQPITFKLERPAAKIKQE